MKSIPYAQMARLRLIELLLTHSGVLNRAAIMDYFAVSMPQASLDIRQYTELAPANLIYDMTIKAYRRGAEFKRVWA